MVTKHDSRTTPCTSCAAHVCPLTFNTQNINQLDSIFLPPATKLGQGYVFTGVCDSVNRGCLPQCMLGYTPPGSRHPRGADPHQSRHPPQSRPTPRADTSGSRHPPGADTPQEQTPGADYPQEQPPPRGDTPQSRHPHSRHPPSRHPPEQTPPGADIPPTTEHAGRYGQREGSTHPTGMQSCLTFF